MNKLISFTILLVIPFFVNCMGNYSSGIHSPILFNNTSQNINESYRTGDFSPRIGDAKILKKGQSCFKSTPVINYLIYDSEEASIESAMKDGGISKVAIIDRKSIYLLPVYTIFGKECIIVYGE